jgi:phage terminase small subunit
MVGPIGGSAIWDRGGSAAVATRSQATADEGIDSAQDWLRSLSGDLEGHEREVFRALEATGQFKPSDAPLLAAYCRAAVLERLAVRTFRRSLFNVSSDIGIAADMFRLYIAAIETLERLAPKLGLCPEARLPKDMRGRPRKPPDLKAADGEGAG